MSCSFGRLLLQNPHCANYGVPPLPVAGLRAKIQSRGDGDHLQEICVRLASSLRALRQFHLWIVLEQFQGRIEATTYEQVNRHRTIHILRALWHPLDSRWKV